MAEEPRSRYFGVPSPVPEKAKILSTACMNGDLPRVMELVTTKPETLQEVVPGGYSPLMVALIYGHYEVSRYLILNMTSYTHRDDNRNTVFHYACYLRSPSLVKLLVSRGAAVVDENEGRLRNRALHLALLANRPDIAEYLVAHGASIKDTISDGPNALFSAQLLDRLDAFLWVYNQDPSLVHAVDSDGVTLFLRAVWSGATKIVKWMLDKGLGDVNHGGIPRFKNCLFRAVAAGCYETACYLHERFPHLNERSQDGVTPFLIAAADGRLECFKHFAKTVDDIATACSDDRSTAMMWASGAGRIQIVEWLYSQGVSIEVCEVNHWRPIHRAAANGEHALVAWFIERGVKPDALDSSGWTPLHLAAEFGKLDVAKELIKAGAEVSPKLVNNSKTPFLVAVQTAHLEVARYLHTLDASVIHQKTKDDKDALHLAVHANSRALAEWLVSLGLVPNWTVLKAELSHHSQQGRLQTIQWLKANGVDVTIPGSSGSNLANAVVGGKTDVVKFLVEECGMDIREKLDRGGSLMCLAVRAKEPAGVLNYLFHAGLSIREITNDGCNLMHRACFENSLKAVKWLAKHGLSFEPSTRAGTSCLALSAEAGHLAIVKYLLQKGAPDAGSNGHGALLAAEKAGHTAVAEFLKSLPK